MAVYYKLDEDTVVYYNDQACYYKGQWSRDNDNGLRGDVRLRPVRLGKGEFTFTGNPGFTLDEDGNPIDT